MTTQRVVVVGGGIAGLTAAYRLLHPTGAGAEVPRVVLIDSAERLGGKILSTPFEGRLVDEGADAFLLRVPWAIELCEELGISAERISPAVGGASVAHPGKRGPQLTALPDGLIGGVPTRLGPLLRSPLLDSAGKLRAAADYVLPRRFTARRLDAASVGDIVRARLGAAVASQVVGPLLGSISAGDIGRLDAATSAPILGQALQRNRSLMRGLRRMQPAPAAGAPAPIFGSFGVGMGRLVQALTERLDGCLLRLGIPVEAIRRPGTRFAVHTGSEVLDADAVIIAAPAHAATQMLPAAPDAAAALGLIDYASVAVVTLSVRPDAIDAPHEAGFLVTRSTGWLTTACSYGSAKWPNWAAGGDQPPEGVPHPAGDGVGGDGGHDGNPNVVLRVSVGRDSDDRHTRLDDGELRDTVLAELSSLPPLRGLCDPTVVASWRVSRWPHSLPQYRPGHGHLVDRIEEALAQEMPGVFVTGAAYRGLGIPACIRQGNEAAERATAHLASASATASP
ncbi:protoporphyrinogen oxidase [Candidatus Poriferisodalis multihospitum]|uniref:protoporphyrinogen oxidase n=1 Tax=Candidatus Poriferisodalis multihospitum TaxID=2983191 RepID=UPI002B25EB3D|nr:protoporphyrinogen oxidase [Candidatus Poriferisodalis multihospitum]